MDPSRPDQAQMILSRMNNLKDEFATVATLAEKVLVCSETRNDPVEDYPDFNVEAEEAPHTSRVSLLEDSLTLSLSPDRPREAR